MTPQAEIQKRKQSVSDLKRQVEQITALAGEDKRAGIRVAGALRKRKLRASLKDVKIREPADVQRRQANSADIYSFLSCYFPDVFCTPKSATRSWPWTAPPSGEPRRRPTVHPDCAPCAHRSHPLEHFWAAAEVLEVTTTSSTCAVWQKSTSASR